MDTILTTQQPHFDAILELYPHYIHGRSRDGCCVLYEVLGSAKPTELARLRVSPESMVWHFVLRNELLFSRHDNSTDGFVRLMTVLDVKNISVTDITTDVISFIRQSSEVMDAYYPCRVRRLVICNAPYWFYSVWSMVARVLPDSARAKISIIHDTAGLVSHAAHACTTCISLTNCLLLYPTFRLPTPAHRTSSSTHLSVPRPTAGPQRRWARARSTSLSSRSSTAGDSQRASAPGAAEATWHPAATTRTTSPQLL